MEPQYALVGAVAFLALQLAGRLAAGQAHPWRDSVAGAVVFTIVLVLAPAIGGAIGVALLALTVVGLLLLATLRPDQLEALTRLRR